MRSSCYRICNQWTCTNRATRRFCSISGSLCHSTSSQKWHTDCTCWFLCCMGWCYTMVRKLGKTQLTGIELRYMGKQILGANTRYHQQSSYYYRACSSTPQNDGIYLDVQYSKQKKILSHLCWQSGHKYCSTWPANHLASINQAGFSSALNTEWLSKWLHE